MSNRYIRSLNGYALRDDDAHRRIDGKLDTSQLPDAVDNALAQAKASGEFNGKDGKTPVKHTDYWTDADKREIIEETSDEVRNELAYTATPQMYGAVGDGVIDDTAAFVAALADNDVVYIPEGRYVISEALYIGQGKTLYGAGIKSVLICTSPENFLMLSAETTVRGIAIEMRSDGFVGNAITVNEASLATANMKTGYVGITIEDIDISWHDYAYSQCANIQLSVEGSFGSTGSRNGYWGVTIRDVRANGQFARNNDVGYFFRGYASSAAANSNGNAAWITGCLIENCSAYAIRWGVFLHSGDDRFADMDKTIGVDALSVIRYQHQCISTSKGYAFLRHNANTEFTNCVAWDWQFASGDYKERPYCFDYTTYETPIVSGHRALITPAPRIDRYMFIKPDGSLVKSEYKDMYLASKHIGTEYVELDMIAKQFSLKNGIYGACIYRVTDDPKMFNGSTYYGVHFQLFDKDKLLKNVTVNMTSKPATITVDRPLSDKTKIGYVETDGTVSLYVYSTVTYNFNNAYLINLPISNYQKNYSGASDQSNYNKTINTFGLPDADKYLSAVPGDIVEITDVHVVTKDGKDGVSATHSWDGTVLTVTSASGTSSADLKGAKGDKGDIGNPGTDGVSPTVSVSKSGKVTTVTITDKNGTKSITINDGADGKTPAKGTDYLTDADKAEMVSAVIAALPVYAGEVV